MIAFATQFLCCIFLSLILSLNTMIASYSGILFISRSLIYLVVSLPFKIAHIIYKDKKDNPSKKKKRKSDKEVNFENIEELLFSDCKKEFQEFYNLYLSDKKHFNLKYGLNQHDKNANSKPIEILQSFGDLKQKIGFIDWKGEENIKEIEEFIEAQIGQKPVWTNTILLRSSVDESKQYDGKFIIKLLKAIDSDLQSINQRLLFLNMDWDAYVYIPLTTITFDKIIENAPNEFQSANDL